MKRQTGFTLIELVVVIVIAGVLAVTAAPKFFNLGSNTNEAELQSLKGTIIDAANIVHSKAILEGKADRSIDWLSDGTQVRDGWPTAKGTYLGYTDSILSVIDGLDTGWKINKGADSGTEEFYLDSNPNRCVHYEPFSWQFPPVVEVTTCRRIS